MQGTATARTALRLAPICASVLLAFGPPAASAADAVGNDGFVHFANVRVVNAPSTAATPAATDAGLRVYRDSATGEMRGPSPEEMQSAAAAPATARASRMTQFASWHSGVGIVLDESFLQYSVVVRNADGSLSEVCVDGVDKADAINRTPGLIKATPKETINVR